MDGLFSAAGSIGAASINSAAVKDAAQMQVDAANKAREYLYQNIDTTKMNAESTAADIQKQLNSLKLQAQTDPALAATRYASENKINSLLDQIGVDSGKVSSVATQEALTGNAAPGSVAGQAKQSLIDRALDNLKAGATLPPDVEAQLMQSGLESSGMVTGAASGRGVGGQQLRTVLGTAGVALQAQREQAASALLGKAQDLETSRQSILQNLFPSLATVQLNNLTGAEQAFGTSNNARADAGLTGSDIANIWLAKVGASNALTQHAADAAGKAVQGQGQIWSNALGNLTSPGQGLGSGATSAISSLWKSLTSSPAPAPKTGGGSSAASSLMDYYGV